MQRSNSTRKIPRFGMQHKKLKVWMRTRLWAQVMVGLVLGIGAGALLGPDLSLISAEAGETTGRWLAIPGRIFLGLISLVLVPLVMISIIQGITGSGGGKTLRRLGTRLLVFVVITTTIASVLGVVLASAIRPGESLRGIISEVDTTEIPVVPLNQSEAVGTQLLKKAPDLIVEVLPTNATEVILDRNMLAIVIISVLVGIACTAAGKDRVRPLLEVLAAVLDLSMTMVKWAMFLAPLAVFGLIAQLVIQVGLGTVGSLATYAGTVLGGLLLVYAMFMVIVAVLTKQNLIQFAKHIAPVQLMAFSTSSTAAVMPVSINTAVQELKVSPETANLVIPLAATINMAGTALYQSIAIMFLAQAAGLDLSLGVTIGVVVSVVAASIGAPGTPGVGVVILAQIAAGAGIPATGLPLVLGLDRPLDMARTAVNVTGDLAACAVVDDGVGRAVRD